MSTSRLIPGAQYFADPRTGRPVASAMIYIGQPNLDPTVLANRVTVNLIKQDGSTVVIPAASQPLTTTAGGLLSYAGSAVQAEVPSGAYSIALHDSNNVALDYFPSVESAISVAAPTLQADNFYTNDASSVSNAYVIIPPVSPAPDTLLDGQEITFRPSANNSGASTINVIGAGGPIGAYPWVLADGASDIPADYVKTTRDYKVRWKASSSKFVDQDLGLFSYNPSIQAWNTHIDYYKVPSYVTGSDTYLYKSKSQTGPSLGGSFDPVSDAGVHWTRIVENTTIPTTSTGTAGHLYPLLLSNNAGTPATILDISAGSARDSTNQYDLTISTGWTKKINAVWASGTGNGGFPSTLSAGAPVNGNYYSFWIIGKTDGTIDFGFDSEANGVANTPTLLLVDAVGYTLFRRIGYIYYTAAAISRFSNKGNQFALDESIPAVTSGASTVGAAITVRAPKGTLAICSMVHEPVYHATGAYYYGLLTATAQSNSTPSASIFDTMTYQNYNGNPIFWSSAASKNVLVDSSHQIRYRVTAGTATVTVHGWIDDRL